MKKRMAAAAALTVVTIGLASPAHAIRVSPDYVPVDRCANLEGVQSDATYAFGAWRYKTRTEAVDDCRIVRRRK